MHANKREEIKEVYAGDIAAAVGLKSVSTGDTLCDEKQPIVLESMDFPKPVISLAIEPKTKADQEKLGVGLQKLMAEDPTFRVQTDQQTGQVIIAGMGELHLEIIVDRLKREFSVEATRRQAAGRLQGNADASGRRRDEVRQADRRPRPVRPRARFISIRASRAPATSSRTRSPAARFRRNSSSRSTKGIKEALTRGVLAGYPIDDVRIELYDGSYHDVDSSEMAFKIAGSMAFQDAAKKARPVLLEPMMRVEVVVPKEHMGDVMGNLVEPARPDSVAGRSRRHADHQGARAAVGDVRLRDRPPVAHAGARDLLDALRSLRAGAAERERRSRRADAGEVAGQEVEESEE